MDDDRTDYILVDAVANSIRRANEEHSLGIDPRWVYAMAIVSSEGWEISGDGRATPRSGEAAASFIKASAPKLKWAFTQPAENDVRNRRVDLSKLTASQLLDYANERGGSHGK